MKKGQYKHTPESLKRMVEARRKNGSYNTSWNKGIPWGEETRKKQSLENGNNWLGNRVGYSGIHKRVAKYFKADKCEWCGSAEIKKNGNFNLQWANKTGKYLFERKDWLRLCPKCHRKQEEKIIDKRLRNWHGKPPPSQGG